MADLSEEAEAEWYPYEGGRTIHQLGGQGGYILEDEEFGDPSDPEAADARLTLEQGRAEEPGFFLTAAVYGWMLVTVRRETRGEADAAYRAMRAELTRLAALLPYEEDGPRQIDLKARELTEAVAAFEIRFS
ncbi:MAG: hypothetical protein SFU56_19925 [Capsulimonadales bacterium]|nr:hypothetical protein [Capsulimonadales bacterium]